ncbi:hypothetical protein TNCV_551701 [Trichonephila clavipes]|nr:hypothetical protein TNCV_551701 [Trichonephila clavipes]
MDANSKSEVWFSPVTDSRGIKLCEFFSTWQLFTINENYGLTFCADQGTSYIDITAVGYNVLGLIERGIEISSINFTSSFEETIDAVLRKSFPCDPNSHDNSQHRVLRSEAELVYESDDGVLFFQEQKLTVCVL